MWVGGPALTLCVNQHLCGRKRAGAPPRGRDLCAGWTLSKRQCCSPSLHICVCNYAHSHLCELHRWVHRLEAEFFVQGDLEREAMLPVSPLMDRTKAGITRSQPGVRMKGGGRGGWVDRTKAGITRSQPGESGELGGGRGRKGGEEG